LSPAIPRVISPGSSPRLRGTQPQDNPVLGRFRFIPAPAGNTCWFSQRSRMMTVHPRACGEHSGTIAIWLPTIGSSPRLRGTLDANGVAEVTVRFIPAPAGNTPPDRRRRLLGTVHPRACGEHKGVLLRVKVVIGSSPRLRGTLPRLVGRHHQARFIPAPAGNTPAPIPCSRISPVHPRACGEHKEVLWPAQAIFGSSPRLRGTQWRVEHHGE